ncbi:MAG: hypothetical protein ACK5OB_11270 [Pirellula sp.]|jgi:hypothetical protein
MPKLTVAFGGLLCAVSILVVLYLLFAAGGEVKSPSVLIPCAVGIPLIILGIASDLRPNLRKHLMHAAVTVGLLGALAALGRGIPQLIKVIRGEVVDWLPLSSVWAMAILCVTYVFVCVESFVAARRARQAAHGSEPPAS